MKFFDRFLKGAGDQSTEPVDAPVRKALVELVLGGLRDKSGRIRAEDAISAAATVVGERCIDAAGDFPLRTHEMAPGSRVFSTKANALICGDVTDSDLSRLPKSSIVGILRNRLDAGQFTDADFPSLSEVFKQYAARIGNPADWGKVPLSVSPDNFPFIPPLRGHPYLSRRLAGWGLHRRGHHCALSVRRHPPIILAASSRPTRLIACGARSRETLAL